MIQEMVQRGNKVIAVAPESSNGWSDQIAELGADYVSAYVDRTGTNPINDLKSFLALYRVLKQERPDVVFAYHAKTNIHGSIAARLCRVPSVNVLLAGLGSAFHGVGFKNWILRTILCTQYRIALKGCDHVFFQNTDDLNAFLELGLVSEEQTSIINGSGVNLDYFSPQKIPADYSFLFVGRLLKDKGIMEYMEAARVVKKRFPGAHFRIVGPLDSNPTAIGLDQMQPYIDDKSVEYLGSTDDVRPYLKECTVFVLPSYHEGTPKSVLEAMAVGRPILTTDAPGCRETVVDGVNGLLVPAGDSGELAKKMMWFIENRHEVELMGKESLRICREKYDVRKVNSVLLNTMGVG